MTASVHRLMHLPTVVTNLGPLWCNSCFSFESANGDLLKLFHGTQAVDKQVRYIYQSGQFIKINTVIYIGIEPCK